jgi:hypothetical protein
MRSEILFAIMMGDAAADPNIAKEARLQTGAQPTNQPTT